MATITSPTTTGQRRQGRDQARTSPAGGGSAGKIGGYAAKLVLAVFFGFPLLFMFVSSLKPDEQIFADMESLRAFLPVGEVSFDNYQAVFDTVPAGRFLLNSIALSGLTVLLGLLVNSLAAFSLQRLEWR